MSERSPSYFASLSVEEFIKHLENHSIVPTDEERTYPIPESARKESGFEFSILQVTGQRFGDSISESSAK